MKASLETWASGDAYEHYMGRWSEEVAKRFLDSLQARRNAKWLDVGCGTGALARVISGSAEPKMIAGLDLSFDFVAYAQQRSHEAEFINASAISLPLSDDIFDFVVSGLALNFVPQAEAALSEFVRVVKSGGIVAAYVWDYAGKMEFLRYFWDAALVLNPSAKALHEGYRFPICQTEPLKTLWDAAGLRNVSVQPLDAITRFDSFDSYWQVFTLGKFPAPQYLLSLNEESRAELYRHLQAAIPIQDDGSIQLVARAWAVSGEKA